MNDSTYIFANSEGYAHIEHIKHSGNEMIRIHFEKSMCDFPINYEISKKLNNNGRANVTGDFFDEDTLPFLEKFFTPWSDEICQKTLIIIKDFRRKLD